MAKITYENKVALNQNSSIPDINKVNDTDMNMIKNVVNNNETKVLLAVSSSAPATCDTGDIYFNTTDNLIYTATATDTWSSTGVAPTENTIYIEFTSQTAYAYDGTTLVSVGGGSGSEIVIGDEEPTEDTKMIIDTDAFDPQYSDITDEYSEANNKAYSCNYINKCNTYSTSEVFTGKYFKDGKPIYKITFYQSSYTQATNFNISISALNIDKLVLPPYGMTYDGTQQIPIPFANQSNEVNYAFRNGNNLACYLMYGTSADITIEYTKTTD